ncbi:MAG TPA: ATP-dependent Clp protease adapter ClpS [Candidatus Hydrogenedentes bacterium]|nr:ATP-dependent Clp protease adapter ClpS [Candidatus Hydrogenedentota bacterium]
MGEYMPGPGEAVSSDVEQDVQPPAMYRVLLHNDDYTTMDFVVAVLEGIFRKPRDEAVRIMLNVHHGGTGVCGVYPGQVAETKVAQVHAHAKTCGYPLKCSMEPE